MKYTTVLWDLDGTIIDSGPGVFDSFRKTFHEMGVAQPSDAQMRTFLGPPLRTTFAEEMGFNPEQTERALGIYRGYYHAGGALNATEYPGVVGVIRATHIDGRSNSLATSKALMGVRVVGEHFGFLDAFDFLGTADWADNRISKTDVVAYALDGLRVQGANLDRVILVGDRIHDIEGARDHGIEVALVKWGYGSPDEWAQADHVVETPEELLALLLEE
ncbi:MAG: HAD hydrolase-like protein [Micrococcales bacterium]